MAHLLAEIDVLVTWFNSPAAIVATIDRSTKCALMVVLDVYNQTCTITKSSTWQPHVLELCDEMAARATMATVGAVQLM